MDDSQRASGQSSPGFASTDIADVPPGHAGCPTDSTLSAESQRAGQATGSIDGLAGVSTIGPAPSHVGFAPLGRFAGYDLLEVIARGGMGIVYKARQIKANRTVALKMILAGRLAGPADVKRFETEASAAATLDHPNIVPVFEVGEHEGRQFYSMGFVDGQSLSDLLREGPRPPQEAARLMRQVAQAVEYAHAKGIIHRDLKPQNILLSRDGTPRVTDFGLAKHLSLNTELTATGQILGTPPYMSPEQARGDSTRMGPLSDVYSLGAVLYCLLTGRPPLQAADVIETLRQVVTQEPVPPRLLNATVDRDLETITLKCLQKEPAKRYRTAAELADDLGRFLGGEPINARPVGAIERGWRWCRRKPAVASLVATVVVVLVVGSVTSTLFAIRAYREADRRSAAELERSKADVARQINEFYATVNQVKEEEANPTQKWTWSAGDLLKKLSTPNISPVPWDELRTLAAETVLRSDLRRVATFASELKNIGALAFSPDGRRLAVAERLGDFGCRIQVWSVPDPRKIQEFGFSTLDTSIKNLIRGQWTLNLDTIDDLAWSPDGRWIIAGTRWSKLARCDTSQAKSAVTVWDANQGEIKKVSFSPDGRILYSGGSRLRRWDAAAGWEEIPTADNKYDRFTISPSRGLVAVRDRSARHLKMLDPTKLEPIASWPLLDEGIGDVAFSPDDRFVAASTSGGLSIRESRTGEKIAMWVLTDAEGDFGLREMKFSADGTTLVGLDLRRRFHFWDVGSGRETMPPFVSKTDDPTFAVNPQGGWLAITSAEASIHAELYEWKEPRVFAAVPQTGTVRGIDLSPDGKKLAVCCTTILPLRQQHWNQLLEWDLDSRRLLKESRITYRDVSLLWKFNSPSTIAWDSTGRRIARDSGWCGIMICPAHGQGGGAGIVHHPDSTAPIEISPVPLAQSKLARGATLLEEGGAGKREAVLVGGAGKPTGDPTLALCLRELPLEKMNKNERSHVLASVRLKSPKSPNSSFEFGSLEDRSNGPSTSSKSYAIELPDDDSQWYALDDFPKTEPDRSLKYVFLKTPSDGPPRSLILDRVLMISVAQEGTARAGAGLPPSDFAQRPFDPCDVGPVCWSPDGTRLWGLVHHEIVLASWNTHDYSLAAKWRCTQSPANIRCLCVGRHWVLCGQRKGNITLIPARDGQLRPDKFIPGPGGAVQALALGPREAWFVLGTQEGNVEFRQLPSGNKLGTLPVHPDAVGTVAITQDGERLVTGCADGRIRIFEIRSPSEVSLRFSINPRAGGIAALRISPDGRRLAAFVRGAREVLFWDLEKLTTEIGQLVRDENIDAPRTPAAATSQ